MSLRDSITPAHLANRVRMQRQQFAGAFLLVEGTSDSKVLRKFCEARACRIIDCQGKEQLRSVLMILEESSFTGIFGIADRDFSAILGKENNELKSLIFTSDHDLECMLLRSSALEHVLMEFASEAKLAGQTGGIAAIRNIVVAKAAEIGCLRLISLREMLHLDFDGLEFKFVSSELNVDHQRLINQVVSRTKECRLDRQELREKLALEHKAGHDVWAVCVGHDAICILSIGLRKQFGSRDATEVAPEILERELRLAFHREDFEQTQLFASLRAWETENPDYQFLKR